MAAPPVRRCDGGTLGQASQLAPFTAPLLEEGRRCIFGVALVQASVRAGLIRCIGKRPRCGSITSNAGCVQTPPLKRYTHLCPTPSWDFGCESMIRTRRVAFAQGGCRFSLGTSAKRLPGDHPQRHQILIRFNPIGSGSVARASNPEFLALSPACAGNRTTERATDLSVVLLDTCRLQTEREEQNAGPVGHP